MVRPRKAKIALPPNINAVRARGKDYYYFHPSRGTKRSGKAVRISGQPIHADGSPNMEWWDDYRRLSGEDVGQVGRRTFTVLVEEYRTSPEWNELATSTQEECDENTLSH